MKSIKMKKVAVLFGGVSAEHEVSVITGLQVLEQIDREKYFPLPVYVDKKGIFHLRPNISKRSDFYKSQDVVVFFGKDKNGVYIGKGKLLVDKQYLDCAFLAFHGGYGESGQMQGFFETLGLPFTSPGVEASAVTMNKALTNQVLRDNKINVVDGLLIFADEIKKNISQAIAKIKGSIGLPVIIKPVHLGSSIAINIARSGVELKKYLLEASYVDSEILVEKLLSDFVEYNCAVRKINNKIECSEIERPIRHDEILSFADKYQKGGNKKAAGMASLVRELPAKMPAKLKREIADIAKRAFVATRCKGMVRIDFMVTKNRTIYLTEINPIPGSMAFYLWEAGGITFTQQITDLIEQSFVDFEYKQSLLLDYESDIVEKFVKG